MLRSQPTDRRQARTRKAVLGAFASLLWDRRYGEIRTGEITRHANVGRSTFYRHFRNKDEVLEQSMEWMLVAIAEQSINQAPSALAPVVDHLWANRRLARDLSRPPTMSNVHRSLTAQLETCLDSSSPTATRTLKAHRAVQIAGAQLAFLEAWLKGEVTATRDEAVERLIAATRI